MALKSKVSGISTDTALFSKHGAQLVHHYRVFGVAHASLRGLFMIDLLYFTNLKLWPGRYNNNYCPSKFSINLVIFSQE